MEIFFNQINSRHLVAMSTTKKSNFINLIHHLSPITELKETVVNSLKPRH
ncbi:hypothetical protein CWATWH0005_1912 [Crocosphaera watsonii WH 0005]|uniref:Uncharacterized protein n=1 Tax=Crocosphaera watsonii WH 0005 TaxID=423472 RepID=T2ISM9_CROWT|nr:hypothetical protein CWATWH0005_1912 [Crocosphaera watsonii WH 0005]